MRDVTRCVSLCYVRRDKKSLHVTQRSLVFCRLVVHHSAMLPGSVAMAIGIGNAKRSLQTRVIGLVPTFLRQRCRGAGIASPPTHKDQRPSCRCWRCSPFECPLQARVTFSPHGAASGRKGKRNVSTDSVLRLESSVSRSRSRPDGGAMYSRDGQHILADMLGPLHVATFRTLFANKESNNGNTISQGYRRKRAVLHR